MIQYCHCLYLLEIDFDRSFSSNEANLLWANRVDFRLRMREKRKRGVHVSSG
jgi:hypothetical protein